MEMLSVKDVAKLLGVHMNLIYGLVKDKKIPHARIGGRIVFTQATIYNWIHEQEKQSLQDGGERDELY